MFRSWGRRSLLIMLLPLPTSSAASPLYSMAETIGISFRYAGLVLDLSTATSSRVVQSCIDAPRILSFCPSLSATFPGATGFAIHFCKSLPPLHWCVIVLESLYPELVIQSDSLAACRASLTTKYLPTKHPDCAFFFIGTVVAIGGSVLYPGSSADVYEGTLHATTLAQASAAYSALNIEDLASPPPGHESLAT
ncbi:hypothetical protein OE88DRAFT_124907 [Heliocybe sulcata]|uniref:Uncharacterized protein n=1 Tax=Heliocybe sulcata TaxID=5364 RepID=A0A5C3NJB9_9AGAM|nr:hypothetical protein OE88DRAFT_124907 [Heliocybe sulcata]